VAWSKVLRSYLEQKDDVPWIRFTNPQHVVERTESALDHHAL
jgi:hypothetical protein